MFSTTPTSLHEFEWHLAGMLQRQPRSTCGEIIHVWQFLTDLWSLTLMIFRISIPPTSLHGFEWHSAGMFHYKSRSACGGWFMFDQYWQSYGPWHIEFLHILACLLNSSYILPWIWMKLGRDVAPHVYMCMWGNNSYSEYFARIIVL